MISVNCHPMEENEIREIVEKGHFAELPSAFYRVGRLHAFASKLATYYIDFYKEFLSDTGFGNEITEEFLRIYLKGFSDGMEAR